MTKLEPYAAYKESGYEWVGSIPTHWSVVPSKWLFRLRAERPEADAVHLMASQKYGVISQAQFMADKDQRVVQTIVGGENMKKICIDDFLIHLSFQGGIEWSANEGKVSPAYTVLRPNHGVHPPFFYYLLKSAGYIQELRATTNQLRDGQSMNYSQFAMVPLVEVPWEEQVRIARFLDRETAQIDNLISKQERLIELLAEKRQAIITHAVTKGLDPVAATKPSDVPWLGDVPAHWEVAPLKYLLQEPLKYGANESAEFDDPTWPRYLRITDFQSDGALKAHTFRSLPPQIAAAYMVKPGDVLFARSGATVGKTFIVPDDSPSSCFAGYLIKASCDRNKLLPSFFSAYTKSSVFAEWKDASLTVATIQNIGADKLSGVAVPVPPLIEQLEIIGKLQGRLSKLDVLMGKAKDSVILLLERRSALISAAVTGKINVEVDAKEFQVA